MSCTTSVAFFNPLTKFSTGMGTLILRGRIVNPIERLPNELLSAVFTFAIEPHGDDDDFMTPTTLSHVCARWRQVSIGTGSLWTHIVLTFPLSAVQLARTLTWLRRSKTYSLDLLLDFRDPDWDFSDEDAHGFRAADMNLVLSVVMPYAPRWRRVELFTDTWAPISAFLRLTRALGTSLTRLIGLHLARCNAYFARKGQVFEPASLGAHLPLFGNPDIALPCLREVSLTGVHIDWAAPPLAGLTTLELKYHAADVMPTLSQFAVIVSACPALSTLALVGRGPQFPISSPGSSNGVQTLIRLENVTQFTFGFVDVAYAIGLLTVLELPTLQKLSLENVGASLREEVPDDAGVLLEWLCETPSSTSNDNTVTSILADAPTSASTASTSSSSASIPLGQLTTLALISINASLANFEALFAACMGVRILRLCDIESAGLQPLLRPPADPTPAACSDANSPSQPLLLPQLNTLIARDVDRALFSAVVCARGARLGCAQFEGPEE